MVRSHSWGQPVEQIDWQVKRGVRRIACITEKLVQALRSVTIAEQTNPPVDTLSFQPNCLIVEDDPNDSFLSQTAVEAVGGVKVTVAKSGDEAISLLKEAQQGFRPLFHIVFLDLNLIGSTAQGYEVLSFLRIHMPKTHTVVVSGYVDDGIIQHLVGKKEKTSGYVGIIHKPLQKEDLREILAKHRMGTEPDPCANI